MSYYKTISSSDDIAFVNISGWPKPALALSVNKIQDILERLSVIGDDMISSKEGRAGEALHLLEEELSAHLRSCQSFE